MELIYWPVPSSSRKGGDGVKGSQGGIVILARCEFYFIKEHKNMMQHPSNNTFIVATAYLHS